MARLIILTLSIIVTMLLPAALALPFELFPLGHPHPLGDHTPSHETFTLPPPPTPTTTCIPLFRPQRHPTGQLSSGPATPVPTAPALTPTGIFPTGTAPSIPFPTGTASGTALPSASPIQLNARDAAAVLAQQQKRRVFQGPRREGFVHFWAHYEPAAERPGEFVRPGAPTATATGTAVVPEKGFAAEFQTGSPSASASAGGMSGFAALSVWGREWQ